MELKAIIKAKMKEQEEILNKSIKENRNMTPQEKGKYDSLETEIKNLETEIEDNTPVNEPLYSIPKNQSNKLSTGPFIKASDKKFSNMFESTHNNNFKSFKDFANAVKMRDSKRLIQNSTGNNELIGSSGGFFVPDEFSSIFIDKTIESSVMLPGCSIYPMKSNTLTVPAWDSFDHSAGIFGSVKASWLGEGVQATTKIPKARQIQLTAKKLAIFSAATQELVDDAVDFESNLEIGLAQAATWQLDDALINGTGVGMPTGILSASSTVQVAKETGQAAATIIYDNITLMMSRLHPACWENAVWLAHPSTLDQLLKLSMTIGTAGAPISLTFENGQYMLMGKPVLFTEKCKTLGTAGDIILVDRSQYIVGLRKNITLDMSTHVYFNSVENAYRAIMRVDGVPAWSTAVTPANGSNTLTWCVKLATRS